MTRISNDRCATCIDYPIGRAHDGHGHARCPWFDLTPRWDDRACVLYVRDKKGLRDPAGRRRWVELIEMKHPPENAPHDET